jgi:hypothetical protein
MDAELVAVRFDERFEFVRCGSDDRLVPGALRTSQLRHGPVVDDPQHGDGRGGRISGAAVTTSATLALSTSRMSLLSPTTRRSGCEQTFRVWSCEMTGALNRS